MYKQNKAMAVVESSSKTLVRNNSEFSRSLILYCSVFVGSLNM